MASVAIVGAGMAGLTAAADLSRRGHEVTVLDKGRSVGGRLATRRIAGATLDHGAQFFTVRSPDFAAVVAHAEDAGWSTSGAAVRASCGRHARYAGSHGMNGLAKHLAVGLDVTVGSRSSRSVSGPAGGRSCTKTERLRPMPWC